MFKIAIPKPCHKDWNAMSPNQQGRYCTACAKTVTDFTLMSDEEIKSFFINKKDEEVCGRFKHEQLSRIVIDLPGNILYIDMPLWKKFLVACLIVFSASLFSCDTTINGKQADGQQVLKTHEKVSPNQNINQDVYVGGLSYTLDSFHVFNDTITVDCPPTYGFTSIILADTMHIDTTTIVCEDSVAAPIMIDSLNKAEPKNLRDSSNALKTDSLKTKNPPKADSIDCNTQTYY
jgi:hypothetical protein